MLNAAPMFKTVLVENPYQDLVRAFGLDSNKQPRETEEVIRAMKYWNGLRSIDMLYWGNSGIRANFDLMDAFLGLPIEEQMTTVEYILSTSKVELAAV